MNATAILEELDEREIRERLDDIDRERDALMVLLRAAMRKQPKSRKPDGKTEARPK